jgi:hypothetical protein
MHCTNCCKKVTQIWFCSHSTKSASSVLSKNLEQTRVAIRRTLWHNYTSNGKHAKKTSSLLENIKNSPAVSVQSHETSTALTDPIFTSQPNNDRTPPVPHSDMTCPNLSQSSFPVPRSAHTLSATQHRATALLLKIWFD